MLPYTNTQYEYKRQRSVAKPRTLQKTELQEQSLSKYVPRAPKLSNPILQNTSIMGWAKLQKLEILENLTINQRCTNSSERAEDAEADSVPIPLFELDFGMR